MCRKLLPERKAKKEKKMEKMEKITLEKFFS
jgi:hypothetical protein